jgi:hypothetical protein
MPKRDNEDINVNLNEGSVEGTVDTNAAEDSIMAQLASIAEPVDNGDQTSNFSGDATPATSAGMTAEEKEIKEKKKKADEAIKAQIGKIQSISSKHTESLETDPRMALATLNSKYSAYIAFFNGANDRIDFVKSTEQKTAQGEVTSYKIGLRNYGPSRYKTVLVATPVLIVNALNALKTITQEADKLAKVDEVRTALEKGNIEYTFDVIARKELPMKMRMNYDNHIKEAKELFEPIYVIKKSQDSGTLTATEFSDWEPAPTDSATLSKYEKTGGHPGIYVVSRATTAKKSSKSTVKNLPSSTATTTTAENTTVLKLSIRSTRPNVLTKNNYIPSTVYGTTDITSLTVKEPSKAAELTKVYLGSKVAPQNTVIKISSELQKTDNNKAFFIAFTPNDNSYWTREADNHVVDAWTGGTFDSKTGSFKKDTIDILGNPVFIDKSLVTSKNKPEGTAKAKKLVVVSDQDFESSTTEAKAGKIAFSTVLQKFGSKIPEAARAYGLTFDYSVWKDAEKRTQRIAKIGKTMSAEIDIRGLDDDQVKNLYNLEIIG